MKSLRSLKGYIEEKKLTPAEMKKREEVAKAIERENPNMPMDKKMAIATATAKKVAEDVVDEAQGSWSVETPWEKSKGTVTDKSGAKHTPQSVARDLARKAMQKVIQKKKQG